MYDAGSWSPEIRRRRRFESLNIDKDLKRPARTLAERGEVETGSEREIDRGEIPPGGTIDRDLGIHSPSSARLLGPATGNRDSHSSSGAAAALLQLHAESGCAEERRADVLSLMAVALVVLLSKYRLYRCRRVKPGNRIFSHSAIT